MALTLKEMISLAQEQYQLRLLTGENALDCVVTWVHMMEDPRVTEFFWGNEVVVTSGYSIRDEQEMLHLVDILQEHHCAALVINIGKYIDRVPEVLIARCREVQLPLLTLPWSTYITEFIQDCCSLIYQSRQEEEHAAQAISQLIRAPHEAGSLRRELETRFQESNGFQMLALYADIPEPLQSSVTDHCSTLRLHTALRSFDFPFLILRHEGRLLILTNQHSTACAQDAARHIIDAMHTALPDLRLHIGIGDPIDRYDRMDSAFQSAVSASRRAMLQEQDIIAFRDMGFYRLLYSVPSDTLLADYYHDTLRPLLDYDRSNSGTYTETLFRYLLRDGSLQAVATDMYTHRNTINYRMGRIRELLGCDLDTPQQRLPYLIAYHIGVILRMIPDLQE